MAIESCAIKQHHKRLLRLGDLACPSASLVCTYFVVLSV